MTMLEVATKALNKIADGEKKCSARQLIQIAEAALTEIDNIYIDQATANPQVVKMRTDAQIKNTERIFSVGNEINEMEKIINDPNSTNVEKYEAAKQRDRLKALRIEHIHQQI